MTALTLLKEGKNRMYICLQLVEVYSDTCYESLTSSSFPLGRDQSLNLACGLLETWRILHHSRDPRHAKSVLFCFCFFPREGTKLSARTQTVFCFPKTTSMGPARPLAIYPTHWNSLMTSDCARDRAGFMRHGFETTLVFNILALQFQMVHSSLCLSSGDHKTPMGV